MLILREHFLAAVIRSQKQLIFFIKTNVNIVLNLVEVSIKYEIRLKFI